MAKNIVICCDGTGNQFGEQNSNVVKLYQTLVSNASQIPYYHPGVGTMGTRNALTSIGKWWTRKIGLAFGYGISDNIADAYQFLMRAFEPGDQVYVFGFSRGAYTARALCGMLHVVGLLTEGNEGLIPYAIRMIKRRKSTSPSLATSKRPFHAIANRISWACGIPSVQWDGSTTPFISHSPEPQRIPIFTLSATRFPLMSAGHFSTKTRSVRRTTPNRTY